MEILKEFGFDPALFFAQIVNFLILAFIFKRFLYKPILKVLKDRQDKIKKSIEDAENARVSLENANSERDEIIKRAGNEAEKIIEETRITASEIKNKILEEAKSESDKIIKDAKEQARLEMEKMEGKVGEMSLNLSEKILEKVLGGVFTESEKKQILRKGVEKISKLNVD